jgi:hypothetical protein
MPDCSLQQHADSAAQRTLAKGDLTQAMLAERFRLSRSNVKSILDRRQRPQFRLSLRRVGRAYNISNVVGLCSPSESFPQAREAAMRAIQLDPSLAEAHQSIRARVGSWDP